MKYLHEHKKEFAMGVLTSIVATTIMDTIKKSFEIVGDSFIPSWTNAIYRRASQITHYTVVEWLVLTVLCVLFFIAIIEIADFAKKFPSLNHNAKANINTAPSSTDTVSVSSNNHAIVQGKTKSKLIKQSMIFSVIEVCFFTTISIIVLYSFCLLPLQLSSQFEIASIEIRPYLTDAEYHSLQSQWVSMCTKDDYDAINAFILQKKEEHNLLDK